MKKLFVLLTACIAFVGMMGCAEVSKGVASVGLETGIPVIFGVLTTDNIEQAIEMLNREPVSDIDATIKVNDGVKFDDLTTSDVKVLDKEAIQKVKTKNPQLPFPLGI